MDWDEHAEREEARYADGLGRLPDDSDARQKQLVRVAMAATGAGLARLMQGRRAEATGWFTRSAERFRDSYAEAPAGSWGRLIGAMKARMLAGDAEGAAEDASWTLAETQGAGDSAIARYAAGLAHLVLGQDAEAQDDARILQDAEDDGFPRPVAEALAALAAAEATAYEDAIRRVLTSFEERELYLEDIPVADTVMVLQSLAERRGFAPRLASTLLPGA